MKVTGFALLAMLLGGAALAQDDAPMVGPYCPQAPPGWGCQPAMEQWCVMRGAMFPARKEGAVWACHREDAPQPKPQGG